MKLNEVGTKNNIFLNPSHSGIKGNEEAKTLAKEGAQMSLISPEPFCGMWKVTNKEFLKKKTERKKLWRNFPEMDNSTKFLWKFETAGYRKYPDLDKNQLHLVTGFLTGHCRLTGECRFCKDEKQTPIHLVTECFGIASLRRKCLGRETCESEELASLKPSQILDFSRSLKLEGEL